jgi:hypothetical protein
MSPSGRLARHVFETHHPGASAVFRPQQSTGDAVYDFDVTYADGTRAALEVTRSTHQESIRTLTHLRGKACVVEAVSCRQNWLVTPLPDCRIDLIRNNVDRCLFKIESEGITQFGAERRRMTPSVSSICENLKILEGRVIPELSPARIWIGGPDPSGTGTGSIVNADDLQRCIEHEAGKDDNLRKLAASQWKERHLFVCVESLDTHAWQALISCTPRDPPVLPAESPMCGQRLTKGKMAFAFGSLNRQTHGRISES